MRKLGALAFSLLALSCGDGTPSGEGDLGGSGGDGAPAPDGGGRPADLAMSGDGPTAPPGTNCPAPLALVDTSKPTNVVGTGNPINCNETRLGEAIAQGG